MNTTQRRELRARRRLSLSTRRELKATAKALGFVMGGLVVLALLVLAGLATVAL